MGARVISYGEFVMLRFCIAALLALFGLSAANASSQAGFERGTTADGTEIGIWYPAFGTPEHQRLGLVAQDVVVGAPVPAGRHPLVVLSHGTGGDFASHADTAVALARAGFVVAALTHPGDNARDNNRATLIEDRPKALSALISYMLADWPGHARIDPRRIGAFGYSSGGFTVLAAAGGRPDMSLLTPHCAARPNFYDCQLLKSHPRPATAWPDLQDARIRAIVAAAPALGFTFDRAGLAALRAPVQLWRANNDTIIPAPFYADAVRAALPTRPEFHGVRNADHFDFLAPCAKPIEHRAQALCTSRHGFDRKAFHVRFNRAVIGFFNRHLTVPPQQKTGQ